MQNFKDYITGALLIGVVLFCCMAFGVSLANNMDLPSSTMSSDLIDTQSIVQKVNETNADTDKYISSFKKEGLSFASGVLVALSIWNIIQLILTSFGVLINMIVSGFSGALGIPPIASVTLISIIMISLIFSAWKTIKQGE